MSKKILFKIWDVSRRNKKFVQIDESCTELCENLILKASEKLGISGANLVLEADGTAVDDDEVLSLMCSQTFILLQPGECWESNEPELGSSSISLASTCMNTSLASTITVDLNEEKSSVATSDTPSSLKAFENKWNSFEVPWEKISSTALKHCQSGERNQRSVHNVIQVVADAMQEISASPPNKAIRIVANKIVSKFPQMFQDTDDDGTVMGDDGAIVVFSQLKERIKYLNRSGKRSLEESGSVPLKQRRKMLSAKAGCSNWQPLPNNESLDETFQNKLKSVDFLVLTEEIEHMLEETYALQRSAINCPQTSNVQQFKLEWPILLCEQGIYWHFQKLTGRNINELGQNMINKYEKVAQFGIRKKYISDLHEEENEIIMDILRVLTKYFLEDLSAVVCEMKTTDFSAVTPLIVLHKEGDEMRYSLAMEGVELGACATLKSAVQQCFALYYNFNLEYPKKASNTFELIQRYFFKLFPEQGNKNTKSKQLKIITFMKKIRDIE